MTHFFKKGEWFNQSITNKEGGHDRDERWEYLHKVKKTEETLSSPKKFINNYIFVKWNQILFTWMVLEWLLYLQIKLNSVVNLLMLFVLILIPGKMKQRIIKWLRNHEINKQEEVSRCTNWRIREKRVHLFLKSRTMITAG
jgi:hypothetical protein